jgi:ribosomal protein S18 acetylase RimI-like enzyme
MHAAPRLGTMHNGRMSADDERRPRPEAGGPGAVTLRTGTVADVDEVLRVWAGAGAHPTSTDDVASVGALVARDPDALLVAEIDGRMVGTLIATWDGWRGNMYRLAVLPDVRRRRIASLLVAEGGRRLQALGCRRVTALVLDVDVHAAEFWTQVGYVIYPMTRYVHTMETAPAGD